MDDGELLHEQRAFYRARAPEYDEWWQRRGHYDKGAEQALEWDLQVKVIDEALMAFNPVGSVLELAGGTGWWTERLTRTAAELTVVDASPEVLALNKKRVDRHDVDYVVADLFEWTPSRTFDVVFFSFWLSHVPRARFSQHWSLIRSCLAPGGRAFFIDNREDPLRETGAPDPYVVHHAEDLHLRRLSDGSEYRVVKVMYEPDELEALICAEGFDARVDATRWFIFGEARPA